MPHPSDSVAHMAPEQQAMSCHPMSQHAAAAYTPESQSILAASGSTSSDSAQSILPSCSIDFTSGGGAGGAGGSSESVTIKGSALGGETINITSDQPFNLSININDGQAGSAAGAGVGGDSSPGGGQGSGGADLGGHSSTGDNNIPRSTSQAVSAGGEGAASIDAPTTSRGPEIRSGAVADTQPPAGADSGAGAVDASSGNFAESQMQQIELMFQNLQNALDSFGAAHGLSQLAPGASPADGSDPSTGKPNNEASTSPLSQAIEASADQNLPPGSARVLASLDPTNPKSLADPENQANPINALTNKSNPNNPETFISNSISHPDTAAKTIVNDVKDIWNSIF